MPSLIILKCAGSGKTQPLRILYGLTCLRKDGGQIAPHSMLLQIRGHGKTYMLCKIDATDLECKLKYVYGLNYFLCPFCFCCIGCNICHLVLNLNGRIFIITRSICSFLVVVFCPPIYMMFVFCCVQIFVLCVLLCYSLPLGSSLPFS